ncbi:signal peptidase II [Gammaproteobacteria bacterium]|jgi:signal peptidase II|nr:signal peptidase II [Gammaproteobacteria bacterium]
MTSAVEKPQRHFRLFILTAGLCLLVAQLVGYWVNASIPEGSSVQINALLNFTHVRNHGGVFGMAQGQGWLFGAFSVLLLAGVCAYLWFGAVLARVEYLCFGLIVGGGASNILDRWVYGSVIDFIDVQGIPYWHYVFNTADVMIHLGIWPMLALTLFASRESY